MLHICPSKNTQMKDKEADTETKTGSLTGAQTHFKIFRLR